MVFSSETFLFVFLPLVLLLHGLAGSTPRRNAVLLGASLTFYAWGEGAMLLLLVACGLVSWALGLAAARGPRARLLAVIAAAIWNIGCLAVVKYTGFVLETASAVSGWLDGPALEVVRLALPLGISFFSFQALSYVVDVARGDVEARRDPRDVLLYITLFPQLVAGPIVRFDDVARALDERALRAAQLASGVRRFVLGLGKKVLVANVLAAPADAVFALPPGELSVGAAWLGVGCYALQIYYDFSGYSDMAIGLGRMLGFELPENFRHPYAARSVTEFWRRWHMTLSTWFRDYVYVPLGGNRVAPARVLLNLGLVFALCGLWHGAEWTFVVWGLWHGALLIVERVGLKPRLDRAPAPLAHAWVLLTVLVGWVLFRAGSLAHAGQVLGAMVGAAPGAGALAVRFVDGAVLLAAAVGVVGSAPVLPALARRLEAAQAQGPAPAWALARGLAVAVVFAASATLILAGTHDPFIYFRF